MTLEKEGNFLGNHEHEWEYDGVVIYTYPPTYHKICKLCGRIEHETSKLLNLSKFNEVYKKFHG